MDLLAASNKLSEIALLSGLGTDAGAAANSSVTALASPDNQSVPLALGQLVSAQVVDTSAQATLVTIAQQSYALNLPVPASIGQTLNLQVLQTSPALQFRLVANLDAPPAASSQVSLSAPVVIAALPSPSPAVSPSAPAPPLLAGTAQAAGSGLGQAIASQIQAQFEAQSSPAWSVGSALAAPADSAPAQTSDSANPGGGALPTFASPGANSGPLANDANHAAVPGPQISQSGSRAIDTLSDGRATAGTGPAGSLNAGPSSLGPALAVMTRPNATASTLAPATWQGTVWPGQTADIQIEPDRKHTAFDSPSLNAWHATLKLTLPNLGQINAQVTWNTAGLRISVEADDATSADQLRSSSGELLDTLRSLDMRVQSVGVRHV